MGVVAVFAAGSGGAGKTTAVVSIGVLLAGRGERVLLVDGSAGLPDLDALLGMEHVIHLTLDDVRWGRCAASAAVVAVPGVSGLWLLPGGGPADERRAMPSLQQVVDTLCGEYDHILIDTPPGNEAGLLDCLAVAGRVVLVAQHSPTHVRGCQRVLGMMAAQTGEPPHPLVLFNRQTAERGAVKGLTVADMLLAWGLEDQDALGGIPEDEAVLIAGMSGHPVVTMFPRSQATKAYRAALARWPRPDGGASANETRNEGVE